MQRDPRYAAVVAPSVVSAMQRDPRVLLANGALNDAASTSPVYGYGGGLARILSGVAGGLETRHNDKKYLGQQDAYMSDMRDALSKVLGGGGATPGATPGAGGFSGLPSQASPVAQAATAGLPPPQAQGVPGGPNGMPPFDNAARPMTLPPQAGPPTGLPPQAGPPPGLPPQASGMAPPMPGSGNGPANPMMNPGMPNAPGVPQPLDSTRLKLGQALMGGSSPYSFMEGLQDVNAGLDEKAQNDALAQQRDFDLKKLGYTSALEDYYGARTAGRGAEYERQSQERSFKHSDEELKAQFEQQWKMQLNQQGFQANEGDKDRLWNTYKLIADTTGEVPGDLTKLQPDAVWGSIVKQESGGDPTPGDARGPATQYGTALGSTQLLPGTAKEMAAKLNVPWQPELLQQNTPDALAYQNKLGRAYFEEGLEKYDGNIPKAVAYYHGGPDESKWGSKTRTYVAEVLGRLPFGIGSDTPKPSNAVFGLNLNSNPKKPVQKGAMATLTDLGDQAAQLHNITSTFDDSYFGYGTGLGGRVNNAITEYTGIGDKNRVEWWKSYDMMNNIVRHNLFGSALTRNEQALWDRATVNPGTTPDVARKRLDTQWNLLQKALSRNARGVAAGYNGRQVYELIGGDDLASMMNDHKPLSSTSGNTARTAQVQAGGGIPKGTVIELPGAPSPARAAPTSNASLQGFPTGGGGFNWLNTPVPSTMRRR